MSGAHACVVWDDAKFRALVDSVRDPEKVSQLCQFPGGKIDPDNTPDDAAMEEAYEEFIDANKAVIEIVGSVAEAIATPGRKWIIRFAHVLTTRHPKYQHEIHFYIGFTPTLDRREFPCLRIEGEDGERVDVVPEGSLQSRLVRLHSEHLYLPSIPVVQESLSA